MHKGKGRRLAAPPFPFSLCAKSLFSGRSSFFSSGVSGAFGGFGGRVSGFGGRVSSGVNGFASSFGSGFSVGFGVSGHRVGGFGRGFFGSFEGVNNGGNVSAQAQFDDLSHILPRSCQILSESRHLARWPWSVREFPSGLCADRC